MKPKTIIKLVYLVCRFIYQAFVIKCNGFASRTLEEIKDLDADEDND